MHRSNLLNNKYTVGEREERRGNGEWGMGKQGTGNRKACQKIETIGHK